MKRITRIVLAKAELDGHDRGINVVRYALTNGKYELFYFGLFQDLDDIVEIAVQEGVDFIGLNVLVGTHLKWVEKVYNRLKNHNALDIGLILGGIIPKRDEKLLKEQFGIRKIFVSGTPEANLEEMRNFFRENPGRTAAGFNGFKTKKDVGLALSAVSNGLMEIKWDTKTDKNSQRKNLTIGITGHVGAGKSSLIDKLIIEFRLMSKKVGVITIDPSDYLTGGAFLGKDRTQMWRHIYDPDVHIYSMATRGYQGGIAEATPEAVEIMKSAGCDIVLVETIGVGQDQVAIKKIVDKVLLVLTPDLGEDQVYKSGIMQIADIYVINKMDICDASPLKRHIENMLDQKKFHIQLQRPKIFKISAKLENSVIIRQLAEILSSGC